MIVKPNLAELSAYAGQELSVPAGVVEASKEILRQGVKLVVTSLAKHGAIAVTSEAGNWWARPPAIEAISEVGSGDAMVAGLVHASLNKESLQNRLRWAVAAGSANAAKLGAGFCEPSDIEPLLSQVAVEGLTDDGEMILTPPAAQ
jgi:fructose-1-phosphate kinase PfkB-like protein